MKKVFLSICLMLLTIVGAKAQSETLKVWLDDNVTFTADGKTVSYLLTSSLKKEVIFKILINKVLYLCVT